MKLKSSIMKRKIQLVVFFFAISMSLMADPPDPNGGGGNGGGVLPGGGAPIGGGVFLFIALAGIYGAKKTIHLSELNT